MTNHSSEASTVTLTPDDQASGSEPSDSKAARGRFTGAAIQSLGISAFLAIAVGAFALIASNFLTYSNLVTILSTAAATAIVTLGQTVVIIIGGFDLSVGGVVPLAAICFVKVTNSGSSLAIGLLAALGVGAVVGLANGLFITKAKINPLITTLGTLSVTGGLAYQIANGQSIPFNDTSIGVLANNAIGRIPVDVLLVVALAVLLTLVLRFTVYGRSIYAIGGNREASWLAGLRVDGITISAYIVCGALAALGGVALASQVLSADGSLGTNVALTSVAAVILGGGSLTGGTGGAFGAMIGVLLLGTLADGLTLLSVSSFYQQIVTGAVLLGAVGFAQLRDHFTGEDTR